MSLTKKLLDDALAGLPRTDDQRRNQAGQFHGPKTAVPVTVPTLPELDFLPVSTDESNQLFHSVRLPEFAAADDGCEDGLGDF